MFRCLFCVFLILLLLCSRPMLIWFLVISNCYCKRFNLVNFKEKYLFYNVSSLHQLSNYILEKKNFFPWRNKLGLWVTTLLSMELFSIISSACYNQFPKQNGSGLRNEILKCMSIPTPRSYTPGCTINPYKNCSRINTYQFY